VPAAKSGLAPMVEAFKPLGVFLLACYEKIFQFLFLLLVVK